MACSCQAYALSPLQTVEWNSQLAEFGEILFLGNASREQ
jgi:hypothetical protein